MGAVDWAMLAAAAALVGLAKTSFGGAGSIAIALFASVLPARESTAALLLLLIVGDVYAVVHYRQHADVPLLRRLLPAVLPGIVLGAAFLAVADDGTARTLIGVLILLLAVMQLVLWRRRQGTDRAEPGPATGHPAVVIAAGSGIGFTTMTANAGGPLMTAYLLAARVDKLRFLGTTSWFFLVLNLTKVPFSAGLGLFDRTALLTLGTLWPAVLAGGWLGTRLVRRVSQRQFERVVLATSMLAAVTLLL